MPPAQDKAASLQAGNTSLREQGTHPVRVVDHEGVGVAVVGRVGIGVVAKPRQHGGDLGHVPHHIPRDLAGPLGERLQVHGLDDLVCGPLDPGERPQGHLGQLRPPHPSTEAHLQSCFLDVYIVLKTMFSFCD